MKPQTYKLTDRMQAYLELQKVSRKFSTVTTYRTSLFHFCDFINTSGLLQNQDDRDFLHSLNQKDLQNFLIELNKKKLAPVSKVHYLTNLKQYLAWESSQENLSPDLLDALDYRYLPKIPDYLPRPLSAEHDLYLQNRWRHSRYAYDKMFLLLRFTGLRISELIQLSPDCVVTNSTDEKYLKVPLGKINNERMVPLNEEALLLIKQIKSTVSPCLWPDGRYDPDRLLGCGGSVRDVYMMLAWRFQRSLGGLTDRDKPITFHRLRHTYATSLMAGGMGIASLMKILGHRKVEMTLRYAKVTPSQLRNEYLKAMAVLENQTENSLVRKAHDSSTEVHPSMMVNQLSAFINKAGLLNPKQKRVLLQKITRLNEDLENVQFSENFKIRSPESGE